MTGYWTSLHSERIVITSAMRWLGKVGRMGDTGGAYMVLVGKLDGKGPLGRPRRRGENDTKMDLQEIGWDVE